MAPRERAQRRAPGHTRTPRHNGRTSTAPPPVDTARPPEAHARQDAPPRHGPDAARTALACAHRQPDPAPGKEGTPTRGEWVPPTGEPPRTPPRSPPPQRHRQATTTATARANTQATAQAPEEEGDTAATPRTGDGGCQRTRGGHDIPPQRPRHTPRGKDPQRTQDQGTGPQGGQPRGCPSDPLGRTAHPDPRNTDPTSHTTPNRASRPPASHITSARVRHHKADQSNQRRPHPAPTRQ